MPRSALKAPGLNGGYPVFFSFRILRVWEFRVSYASASGGPILQNLLKEVRGHIKGP